MRYFFFDQLQKFIILNKMLDQYTKRVLLIGRPGHRMALSAAAAKSFNIHHEHHDDTANLHREEYEQFFVPTLARGFSTRGFSTYNARTIHNRQQGTPVHTQASLTRSTRLARNPYEPTKL